MSGVTKWNQPELTERLRRATMLGLSDWIGLVEKRAVERLQNPPKTGVVYRRRGVEHQASAPGESPASDSGRLVNSRRIELLESQLRARLNFSTIYAAALEEGSTMEAKTGSRSYADDGPGLTKFGPIRVEYGTRTIEPRPYARPALAETFDAGIQCVKKRIAEALK